MLVQSILQNEIERNQKMIEEYKKLIAALPKGSLICKKNEYYYLKYRMKDKVYDIYVGKDGLEVDKLRKQLELRRHYVAMLNELEKEKKTITRLLEVL